MAAIREWVEVDDSDSLRSQMIYRPFEVPSQDEFEELGIFTEQGVESSNRSFVTTDASGADITFAFDIHGRSIGIRVVSDESVILELFREGARELFLQQENGQVAIEVLFETDEQSGRLRLVLGPRFSLTDSLTWR